MIAKPCPVCGSKHIEIVKSEYYNDYLAVCSDCNFSFEEQGLYGDWPEDAVELWNKELEITETKYSE